MPVLDVQNAKKAFGDNEVLHDISFHVDQGEVVAIIGPSGSGKSTLLRCCTTLETLDGGSIYFGEDALVQATPTGGHSSESAGALAWSSRISISFPIFL